MKRIYFVALCALAMTIVACNNDDDNGVKAPSAVKTAFDAMYPDAKLDGWLSWRGYLVADFEQNGTDAQAWFDKTGKWYMTDTEIDYRSLPAAVRTAYQNSSYAGGWNIDDMEEMTRADMETIYVLEIWQGRTEQDLCYTPDGLLVTTIPYGYGDPTPWVPRAMPDAVRSYLGTNYAGYSTIQIVAEGGSTTALINYEGRVRSVLFDGSYAWKGTVWSITESEVPTAVTSALAASQYASYIVQGIEQEQLPTGEYYLYELTNGNQNVVVRFNPEGNIIQ
jgi:hypothetical protein